MNLFDNGDPSQDAPSRCRESGKPDATTWFNKGNALYALGRFEESLAAYWNAIALAPDYTSAWINMGAVLGELDRPEEALAACERATDLEPDNSSAWNNKGMGLGNLGRFDKALPAFERATDLNPHNAYAWNNKGHALHKLARHEESLIACERAIALDSGYAHVWCNKGNVLFCLGRLEEALTAYEHTITLDPENAYAFSGKGNVHLEQGDIETACRAYRRFLFVAKSQQVQWLANNSLQLFGRDRKSPLLLFRLTREYPHLLAQREWLVALRDMEGDYAVPFACIATLASLPPAQDAVERRLRLCAGGCLTFHMGDPMAAESDFFDAMNDEFPGDLLGQYYLVSSRDGYLADNRIVLEEALAAARGAVRSEPEQWYYAARILSFAGEEDEALQALERAGAYIPALLVRFDFAKGAGEGAAARMLAEQILALEHAAAPERRLLCHNKDMKLDLTSTGWLEDVLHWAKQAELEAELLDFLGYLNSADCHDLRLKHGEALLKTQVGAMDIPVAWRLDGKSRLMMEGLANGARRASLAELHLQLCRLNVDVKVFDGLQGVELGECIEAYLRNSSLEMEVETLLVAYFYASKALPLREAFLLLAYRHYRHGVNVGKCFEEWHIESLMNFAGGVGSTVSPLFMWQASGSAVSTMLALLVPAALTWVTSRIVHGKSSSVVDYATFKADLSQEAQKKGWELPEDFWDDE